MRPTRRAATAMLQALTLSFLVQPAVQAQPTERVRLYRVVTMRGDVLLGVTEREMTSLGTGPEVERIARRIAQDGQVTAWRYGVTRGPDGNTRFSTREKVAVLRHDALMVEPYAPAFPVAPPPGE